MEELTVIAIQKFGLRAQMHRSRAWRWGIPVVITILVLLVIAQIVLMRAGPILKGRVIETLSARFGREVQLDSLQVRIGNGINVAGSGLRIFPEDELRAAGYNEPLIAIGHFDFRASIFGLFFKPTHVRQVNVSGLALRIPPADLRRQRTGKNRRFGKIKIRVDEIVCDNSQLVIGTDKPNKDPRVFRLKHIVLKDLGPQSAWPFEAVLTNPVPRGEIHASGTFGPWNTDTPGDSKVAGKYQFEHADLNTIKGLGGILRSTGQFDGHLDRIAIHGHTQVPDFSLDTANHPMPLETEFQATVDGTTGDTYLENIQAKLGNSNFSCSGQVVDVKGQGHKIDIATDVPNGHIEDFLELSVKSSPAPMTGMLTLQAKIEIAPGRQSVSQKMSMQGAFTLKDIHFTNPAIEDKVDDLSLRARGRPDQAKPGAPDVHSKMTGRFAMRNGELALSGLNYGLPGGDIHLTGHYTLDGRKYDFVGTVQTSAELSAMVASKWKSILLKPIDPFFKKHGWGAQIPVKVSSGKDGKPKFEFRF